MRNAYLPCLASLLALSAAYGQCPPDRLVQPPGLSGSFGAYDIEIDGDHLVFGDGGAYTACPIPDPFACSAGAVHTYRWVGGRWVSNQLVVPDDIGLYDFFGGGLDIDGDRMLVSTGAKQSDGRFGLLHDYRFDHDSGQWIEVGRASAPGTGEPRDGFGDPLAFNGGLALVRQDDLIHRYVEGAGGWVYRDSFGAPDGMEGGSFGHRIVILDDWVFVSAPTDSSIPPTVRHGSVYVFRRNADDTLEFHQKLLPAGLGDSGTLIFGGEIAHGSTTLAISEWNATRDFEDQGIVSIYELEDGLWTLKQELTHSDAGRLSYPRGFGRGLSLDGDTLVAAPAPHAFFRFAYVFRRSGDGVWREVAVLETGDATPPGWDEDQFGSGSAVDGDRLVIAARAEIGYGPPPVRTGAAYAFDLGCEICEPDLDLDGSLTIFDFLVYLNLFQDGDLQADLDGDGALTLFDFLAYQTAFDAGCE